MPSRFRHFSPEEICNVITGSESDSQEPTPLTDEALELGLAIGDDARTHVKRKLEYLVKAFNIARVASA